MIYAIIAVVIIVVPLLYLASMDGRYEVRRTLHIKSPRRQVFDKVRDLRCWPDWSPWLMHEPGARLEYSATPDREGGWYSWDGDIVGAGRLSHETFTDDRSIEQRIEFARPFKSVCRIWWEFEDEGDGTLVHWNMAGKMPFLFRYMAKKMPEFISRDFDTGLLMLRAELVESAEVPRFSFDGVTELPAVTMLSIPFEGHLEDMKVAMERAFPELGSYLDREGISAAGPPFTIYTHVDMEHRYFACDMAFPVPADSRSDDYEMHVFPGGRFLKVTMHGSFQFLELAWYQAYSHLQMLKLKPRARRPSIEMYETDPATVSHSNEITTSLYIPVK